ncbi:hypothetical protein D3C76_1124290 [compost metagenome]
MLAVEVGLLALAAGVLVELQPARLAPIIVVRRSVLSPLVLFIDFNVNASLIFFASCCMEQHHTSYSMQWTLNSDDGSGALKRRPGSSLQQVDVDHDKRSK